MKNSYLVLLLVTIILSVLFITLFGEMTFFIKGMEFSSAIRINPSGVTEINIPPLGSILAKTHLTPLKIIVRLINIDIDAIQELIEQSPDSEIIKNEIQKELYRISGLFIARLAVLAVLGGIVGALIIYGKKKKSLLLGTQAGLIVGLSLLLFTYLTFDSSQFRTPEYRGAIKAAPWAITLAETAFRKVNVLGQQMQAIAKNLYTIFERIEELETLGMEQGDLLVLHVSDIHNNPAAHQFILQITKSFPVDFVIDTGDISDYGTPIEGNLLEGLMDLNIPYLFVPGNHDSPQIIKSLAEYPQIQVLSGGIIDVQGLKIMALADPSSETAEISPPAESAAVAEDAKKLLAMWEESEIKPDVLAVHNYNAARFLAGKVPLILYGHAHQFNVVSESGTVSICAGSTGGSGIRGLQAVKEIPYSVVLLHFWRNEENRLVLKALDTIKVYSFEKGFILERKLLS